jgi:hypothetical protein
MSPGWKEGLYTLRTKLYYIEQDTGIHLICIWHSAIY